MDYNYNLFKGLVTHIIDPNNFWMRIGTDDDMHLFSEYQQQLDAFYNTNMTKDVCDPDQMHAGYLVVVAESAQDDRCHWERAQVTRVDSENKTADVFFVDLGFTYIVDLDKCRAITTDVFNFLPPQARRVSLGGVKPLSSSWTTRATSLLQKETESQEVLTLNMGYNENSMCYTVIIYTRQSDGTWGSLIHKMQQEEMAVSTGEMIQEVLTDDIVDKCLLRMDERHKQVREAETNREGDNEKILVEEKEEVEKWKDGCVSGGSEEFLANLMESSQNASVEWQCQSSLSDKQCEVTGFDYRTLMQTRSISLSQMQLEKGMETQEVTKTNIEKDLQRLDSCQSHHDEQDWDLVQDTDFHVDIVSQIYQGVLDRQYSSDDGMSELWDRIKAPPKEPPTTSAETVASSSSSLYPSVKEDIGKRYYHPVEGKVVGSGQADNGRMISGSNVGDAGDGGGGLSEMDSYQLEKKIKEILMNPDGMESDFVCASIYGIVEPDVDSPVDLIRVVICAILEHIMQDVTQHSEIAFAILESYSGANDFGTAMIEVLKELKERFVKKHQSVRWHNSHKDFAHVLALVFKQAEDWEEGTCKAVQDLAVAWIERWVIFNKQRHLSGDDLVQCELVFLESAQTFLMECYDLLSVNYSSNLREIMNDIRCKILQDKTTRSVRTVLLDMLLTLNRDGRLDKHVTCSVGTQTECMEGTNSKFMWTTDVGCGGDHVSTKHIVPEPNTYTNPTSFPGFAHTNSFPHLESLDTTVYDSSQIDWMNLPKTVRNLPPRLLKKYLQEHGLTEPRPPLAASDNLGDDTEANQHDEVCPNFDTNPASPHTVSKVFSSQSLDDQVIDGQNSCALERNGDLGPKFVTGEFLPSTITVVENRPPSPKPVLEKMSPSPKSVVEEMSPSPQPFLTLVQTDQSYLNEDIVHADNEDSEESETKIPFSSFPGEENPYSIREQDMDATLDEGVGLEADPKKRDDQSLKVHVRIERETTIRYTPQQLRDLNPFKGCPKTQLCDLREPTELLDKMISGKSDLKEEETNAVRNYSKQLGSSVDPNPAKYDQSHCNKNSGKQSGGNLCKESGNIFLNNGSGLQGIASDLLKSVNVEADNGGGMDTLTNSTRDGEDWNGGEMWHDNSGDVGDVGEFLKPTKRNEFGKGKKSKNKRGREIPLDQFLQEQEAMRKPAEEVEIVDEDESLISAESLQMYEELEQQGVGVDNDFASFKIGSHISSSSKRPSMFTSVRPEQPLGQRASKPWTPASRRFCTHCGSQDHVVYNCTEKNRRLLQL